MGGGKERSLNYPLLRFGIIIEAERALSDQDSDRVAEAIAGRSQEFLRSMRGISGAECAEIGAERVWRVNRTTPILSFPLLSVAFDRYECDARVALTVCRYAHQSKVWARVSLRTIDGKDAYELSTSDVSAFHQAAAEVCRALVEATRGEYLATLRQTGVVESLTDKYSFQLKGVNSDDQNLEGLLVSATRGRIGCLEDALEIEEHRRALAALFDLALESEPRDAETFRSLVDNDPDWALQLLSAEAQEPLEPVFGHSEESDVERGPDSRARALSVMSIFATHMTDEHTDISSLSFNGERLLDDASSRRLASPAERATGEILEEFASRF